MKNKLIILILTLLFFFCMAFGMLLIIVGLPLTCQNIQLYSIDRIEDAKIGLILAGGWVILGFIILIKHINNKDKIKMKEKLNEGGGQNEGNN